MLKEIWQRISSHRKTNPNQSIRAASLELGVSKDMVNRQDNRESGRNQNAESEFWDSEAGQNFIKRLIISAIYTFGIKGGVGAGRIEEFMKQIRIGTHAGISESSIYRMIKEIESEILRYKELVERDLKDRAAVQLDHLEIVLGLDETWLDKMLLVSQELSSGYLFLSNQVKKETAKAGTNPSNQPSKVLD